MREQSVRDIALTDQPRRTRTTEKVFIVKFSGNPKSLRRFRRTNGPGVGLGDKVACARLNAILSRYLSPDMIGANPFILRASIPVADGKNSALA